MIPKEAMPFKTALVYTYDCGDFGKNLADCLDMADYDGLRGAPPGVRQDTASCAGIGISNTVEASNAGLIEHAELRFDQSGALTVSMGTHDHGQGHAHRVPADHRRQARHPARAACATSTATPTRSRSAPARSARARWPAAAPRC